MRKVISMLAVFLLCFALPVTASANSFSRVIVQPYYEKANNAWSEVSLSATNAICKSYVSGSSDVVKITAEQYLQKQGFLWIWTTYDGAEWTKTVNYNSLTMSNTKSGLSSGTYRLKSVFTLTSSSGKTETITVYSDEKKVG